jgi:hypothetical protein
MSFNLSTVASIVIGATAITGSALAVNLSSSPQDSGTTNTVMQPEQTLSPIETSTPKIPGNLRPISPTPTPSELPTLPPPAFNNEDDEDEYYEDDHDDDEEYEDYEDEDDDEDYEDEDEDYEDEDDD